MLSKCAGSELKRELEGWLSKANVSHSPARAIIAPYPQIKKALRISCLSIKNYLFNKP